MNRSAEPDYLVIRARDSLWRVDLAELWRYREVVWFLVWRDFKVRYRQTLLGVAWALIQPLLTVAIFTLLFARFAGVSSGDAPYPLFALAGFVPWAFFSYGVGAATGCMLANQDLVKRIYFPRLAIPLAAILSGLADMAIGLTLIAAFLLWFGQPLGPNALMLPLFLLQGIAATIGVGLILSAANARFRDIGHAVPFVLQIGLLATPIGYASASVPDRWQLVYHLNPMAGVIDGVRWALLDTPLRLDMGLVSLGMTLLVVIAGALYFHRNERMLADIL